VLKKPSKMVKKLLRTTSFEVPPSEIGPRMAVREPGFGEALLNAAALKSPPRTDPTAAAALTWFGTTIGDGNVPAGTDDPVEPKVELIWEAATRMAIAMEVDFIVE
jgi:hypothetical protein